MVVPELNAKEAAMVSGVTVFPVRSLLDVIPFINTGNGIPPIAVNQQELLSELQHFPIDFESQHFPIDFKDVRGRRPASER